MPTIDVSSLTPIIKQVFAYKIYIVSALVLIIFSLTILEIQQVGLDLTNQTLVQEKRQEILAEKVNFKAEVIDDIIKRTTNEEPNLPPASTTNNPFKYGD